ncbi:hypothetical protein IG197_33380 (plasmid) [Aminobacter sp. SR38]|jgi:hypothetical protein|nr:hypothetical protein IG197_33380 [Aminobacter sp. SR38]
MTAGALLILAGCLPFAREGHHPIVGAPVTKHCQIGMQLFNRRLCLLLLPAFTRSIADSLFA